MSNQRSSMIDRADHQCSDPHWQRVLRTEDDRRRENDFADLMKDLDGAKVGTAEYRAAIFRHTRRKALPWLLCGLPLSWAMITAALS